MPTCNFQVTAVTDEKYEVLITPQEPHRSSWTEYWTKERVDPRFNQGIYRVKPKSAHVISHLS